MEGVCKGPGEGNTVTASVGRGREKEEGNRAFTKGTWVGLGVAPWEAGRYIYGDLLAGGVWSSPVLLNDL